MSNQLARGRLFTAAQRRFRTARFRLIDRIVRALLEGREAVTILDAGGRPGYWKMLAPDLRPRTRITCLNTGAELELHAEAVEDLQIELAQGDACAMPQYGDGAFDLVHSNSVIEHVGSYGDMQRFAAETGRVGRAYYHQTPDARFPIEPHYGVPLFHMLPDSLKARLFTRFDVGYARRCSFEEALSRIDRTRIVSRWVMERLFPDGTVRSERVLMLPKSTIVYRLPEGVRLPPPARR